MCKQANNLAKVAWTLVNLISSIASLKSPPFFILRILAKVVGTERANERARERERESRRTNQVHSTTPQRGCIRHLSQPVSLCVWRHSPQRPKRPHSQTRTQSQAVAQTKSLSAHCQFTIYQLPRIILCVFEEHGRPAKLARAIPPCERAAS